MTAPHIGNTGLQRRGPRVRAHLGRRLRRPRPRPRAVQLAARGARSTRSLREQGVVGICGIDTRALTRHLRERGAMRVGISSTETDPEALLDRVRSSARDGRRNLSDRGLHRRGRTSSPAVGERRFTVAARRPRDQGEHPADDGRARHRDPRPSGRRDARRRPAPADPDGLFFSNGPGRPGARPPARSSCCAARWSAGIPYFGICFGNQLFGRALGFEHLQAHLRPPRHQPAGPGPDHRQGRGHRPQPRLRRPTPRSTSTTSTPYGEATVSHVCLNDDVVEGLELRDDDGRCRRSPCSTTRRPPPAPTTRRTSSTASPT